MVDLNDVDAAVRETSIGASSSTTGGKSDDDTSSSSSHDAFEKRVSESNRMRKEVCISRLVNVCLFLYVFLKK